MTTLEKIAKQHLGLETLKARKSDSLDFREVYVPNVEKALQAAYEAGAKWALAEASDFADEAAHDVVEPPEGDDEMDESMEKVERARRAAIVAYVDSEGDESAAHQAAIDEVNGK